MRVLAVSSYGLLGGAELALLSYIENRPPGVSVAAVLVDDGPLRDRLATIGIERWVASGFAGRPGPAAPLRFARGLRPVLRRERPDVVWALGQKAALLSVAACRAARVPIVWHKVDFSWDRQLARPLAAAVDGVISVSDAVAAAIGALLRRRRHLGVVGPPLALDPGFRVEPDGRRQAIGTLARLVPYKGHHHIVRAAALLSERFPELRVVLAGAAAPQYPGYADELRNLAAELGIAARVELPGFVEPAEALRELTVFVNATYRDEQGFGLEGLSGAMLEASWAGLPVVATAGGGTGEGVIDGATGTLLPRADPQLIADAAARYLADPQLAAATGAAGATFARERFAPRPAAERLFGMLGEVAR